MTIGTVANGSLVVVSEDAAGLKLLRLLGPAVDSMSKLGLGASVSLGCTSSKLAKLVSAAAGGVNVKDSERAKKSEDASDSSDAVVVYVVVS